jgi:hypothetical protein
MSERVTEQPCGCGMIGAALIPHFHCDRGLHLWTLDFGGLATRAESAELRQHFGVGDVPDALPALADERTDRSVTLLISEKRSKRKARIFSNHRRSAKELNI